MNTQTFAQTQNIAPITDDELMAATGGGLLTAGAKLLGQGLRGGFQTTRNVLAADAAIGMATEAINGAR